MSTRRRRVALPSPIDRLIAATGLPQQKCCGCGCLLEAYSRVTEERWTCPVCAVPGATSACAEEKPS